MGLPGKTALPGDALGSFPSERLGPDVHPPQEKGL